MFCQKCGASNDDGATFCSACGASLNQPAGSPSQGPMPSSPPSYNQMSVQRKNPIIAALLGLFFGVGYLYLGSKKILSIPTVLFVIIAFIVYIALGIFTFGLLELVVAILLAYDCYVKAKGQRGILSAEPEYLYGKPMT